MWSDLGAQAHAWRSSPVSQRNLEYEIILIAILVLRIIELVLIIVIRWGWMWNICNINNKTTWKSMNNTKIIKNILKRREESDTHLTHVCRHCRSKKSSMKIDRIRIVYFFSWWKPQCWLTAPIPYIFIELFLLQWCLQMCVRFVSLSSLLFKIFFIIIPFQIFLLC